ncbi:MAG: hypothetical protein RL112_1089, partial [Planctomycetota bacterium]
SGIPDAAPAAFARAAGAIAGLRLRAAN